MADKHSLCKHPRGCLINSLNGYIRGGCIGLLIRGVITLFAGIIRRKIFKDPKFMLKVFQPKSLRLVYFLSGMIGLYRTSICILRRLTNNEKISSFFAGLISSIPLLFEETESRLMYSLYLLVRALDVLINHLLEKKVIPPIKYFVEMNFVFAMAVLQYNRVWNPDCVNKGYFGFLSKFMSEPNDSILLDMIGYTDRYFIKKK
jgi:hypothetical protein